MSFILTLATLVILVVPPISHAAIKQGEALLGVYVSAHETVMVRENRGILEILCNTENKEEKMFETFTSFPLIHTGGNNYLLLCRTPLKNEQIKAVFTTDAQGKGSILTIGNRKFKRKFFDVEMGTTFKIKPLMGEDELRKRALAASPPAEQGQFIKPDLVEIIKLDPTIRLDIRYATTNNFMGIRLYD